VLLTLSKIYDPDCLSRQNVQDMNSKQANVMKNALLCLDLSLRDTDFDVDSLVFVNWFISVVYAYYTW